MAEYRVSFKTGASLSITVEAENEEAALDAAYNEIPRGVCAQCSGWGQKWGVDLGDWEPDDEYGAVEKVEG